MTWKEIAGTIVFGGGAIIYGIYVLFSKRVDVATHRPPINPLYLLGWQRIVHGVGAIMGGISFLLWIWGASKTGSFKLISIPGVVMFLGIILVFITSLLGKTKQEVKKSDE